MKKFFFLFFLSLVLTFQSSVAAHEGATVVNISDTSFSPSDFTIHVGDTVEFVNVGANLHWPASDLHPTHAVYSEFDPKRALKPGESWEFTFNKAGTWSFHDHEAPTLTGVLQVKEVENSHPVQSQVKDEEEFKLTFREKLKLFIWRILPSRKEHAFSKLVVFPILSGDTHEVNFWLRAVGSEKLMKKLIDESGGGGVKDCHQEAHVLGRLAYAAEEEKAFSGGTADCHSGFYHGAMEGLLKEKGTENLSERIDSICKKFETEFGQFECLHGVGHGVLAYTGYDLPKAIQTCEGLSSNYAKSSCYGGVFMENIVAGESEGDHQTKWLSKDPHYPCNSITTDQAVQYECYQMQTSRMLALVSYDFQKVSNECLNAPVEMVSTCFQSLGRDASGFSLRDPKKTIALCNYSPGEHLNSCISGAIQVVVDFWGQNIDKYPYDFCSELEVGTNVRDRCFDIVTARLSGLFGEDKEKIKSSCSYAKEFADRCLAVNGLKE